MWNALPWSFILSMPPPPAQREKRIDAISDRLVKQLASLHGAHRLLRRIVARPRLRLGHHIQAKAQIRVFLLQEDPADIVVLTQPFR